MRLTDFIRGLPEPTTLGYGHIRTLSQYGLPSRSGQRLYIAYLDRP